MSMRARHLAPAVLAAVLLTGCSATSFAETLADTAAQAAEAAEPTADLPSAERLAHDTVAALESARSVSLSVTEYGHGLPLFTNLSIDGADWSAAGGAGLSADFEQVVVGGESYLRASAEFWAQAQLTPDQAQAVAWRWVTAGGTSPAELMPMSQADAVQDLATILGDAEGATVVEGRVAGRPVYILTLAHESGGAKIAAEGPAYPLQAQGGDLAMTFDGFDEPQGIVAPTGAVDIRDFFGG
jgi:hypothetical protein